MDSVNYPLTPWQFFLKYFQCTETTYLQIYYKYRLAARLQLRPLELHNYLFSILDYFRVVI